MSFSMMIHITDGISLLFFSKQTSRSATTQTWIRPKELMLNVVGNLLSFSVHLVDLWCKGDHITRSSALNPTAPFLARCKFVYIYYFLFTYLSFFLHLLGVNVMHCLAIMISSYRSADEWYLMKFMENSAVSQWSAVCLLFLPSQ